MLARAGGASRADLARELDLPKATIAGLIANLVERGLVIETAAPDPRSGPGRPGRIATLAGPTPAIAALTWSTGLLRVTIANLTGRILAGHTTTVEPDLPQESVLDLALDTLRRAAGTANHDVARLAAVVLSLPAPFQRGVGSAVKVPTTGASTRWQWLPAWLDEGLAEELARRAGTAALVENDANLAALGEHTFGAGRGKPDQVYLKLGHNSVGAGLIIGGRLHRGATGFAGELAHIQVRDNGPLCACGGRGCLIRTIGAEMLDQAQPAYEEPLTFTTMLSLAEAGDIGLQRLLTDLGRIIGRPLADLCTLLNPDLFVLDASVGPAGRHIIAGMVEAIERHARPATAAAVRVVAGTLDGHADVLGAVALVRQEREPAWAALPR